MFVSNEGKLCYNLSPKIALYTISVMDDYFDTFMSILKGSKQFPLVWRWTLGWMTCALPGNAGRIFVGVPRDSRPQYFFRECRGWVHSETRPRSLIYTTLEPAFGHSYLPSSLNLTTVNKCRLQMKRGRVVTINVLWSQHFQNKRIKFNPLRNDWVAIYWQCGGQKGRQIDTRMREAPTKLHIGKWREHSF